MRADLCCVLCCLLCRLYSYLLSFGEREIDRVFVYWLPKGLFKEYNYILIEIVLQLFECFCDRFTNIRHITHRNEDENIRHITHWRRRCLYFVFYLSNWLNQTVYYEASIYVFPAYHGCMNCYYDSSSSSCVNTFL